MSGDGLETKVLATGVDFVVVAAVNMDQLRINVKLTGTDSPVST